MFWVRWFETARSVTEPIVASSIHRSIDDGAGGGSSAVAASCPPATLIGGSVRLRQASAAQATTKSP